MRFPFYIVSKGRAEYMITSKALTKLGIMHYIVVEESELKQYKHYKDKYKLLANIIVLDMSFKKEYELCDNFGTSKGTGPGPARNFAWSHALNNGFSHHWVMDDNISGFFRLNKNLKVPCRSKNLWTAMEDFVLRYKNVSMAGPNYFYFSPRKAKQPPFTTNTRIYSCNFIRNDLTFRWRGRYNEDTILSLDMLTAGWCTIQFNIFLQDKMETQKLKGGNTDEFYHREGVVVSGEKYTDTGTLLKSKMVVDIYPNISKIVTKFNRIHHSIDYSSFRNRKLIKKDNLIISKSTNNYGMELKVLT